MVASGLNVSVRGLSAARRGPGYVTLPTIFFDDGRHLFGRSAGGDDGTATVDQECVTGRIVDTVTFEYLVLVIFVDEVYPRIAVMAYAPYHLLQAVAADADDAESLVLVLFIHGNHRL